ncbi:MULTISPECIES: hypothetical protein [Enterococcus]|uniref:Uncharacterized protein n=1 Tax=Enterococcus gilvus ATCC BAA-350 TaxID=1158614 RepID=R2XLV2_9ENTE|nr:MULTISPECIES: hypothetical protein [Enterococcus]EOI55533.1 hypothetical protein UKC_02741 [Enterococcus gilvus ATCC BAA-350]EOW81924.1 hypothetical protein I592_01225 [Enterococcus gilvus ATCC BAA-350]
MSTKKQEEQLFNQLIFSNEEEWAIETLKDLISNHETCKNSYFWSSSLSANGRRATEQRYSRYEEFNLENGGLLVVKQNLSQSCRHTYYSMNIYIKDNDIEIRNMNLKTLNSLLNQYLTYSLESQPVTL